MSEAVLGQFNMSEAVGTPVQLQGHSVNGEVGEQSSLHDSGDPLKGLSRRTASVGTSQLIDSFRATFRNIGSPQGASQMSPQRQSWGAPKQGSSVDQKVTELVRYSQIASDPSSPQALANGAQQNGSLPCPMVGRGSADSSEGSGDEVVADLTGSFEALAREASSSSASSTDGDLREGGGRGARVSLTGVGIRGERAAPIVVQDGNRELQEVFCRRDSGQGIRGDRSQEGAEALSTQEVPTLPPVAQSVPHSLGPFSQVSGVAGEVLCFGGVAGGASVMPSSSSGSNGFGKREITDLCPKVVSTVALPQDQQLGSVAGRSIMASPQMQQWLRELERGQGLPTEETSMSELAQKGLGLLMPIFSSMRYHQLQVVAGLAGVGGQRSQAALSVQVGSSANAPSGLQSDEETVMAVPLGRSLTDRVTVLPLTSSQPISYSPEVDDRQPVFRGGPRVFEVAPAVREIVVPSRQKSEENWWDEVVDRLKNRGQGDLYSCLALALVVSSLFTLGLPLLVAAAIGNVQKSMSSWLVTMR